FNGANSIYSSYSVAHREPTRDDFIQAFGKNEVKPERLDNLETGWKYKNRNYTFSINGFLMNYTNQLVLTGQVNDVGAFVRTNVAKSYRLGMEADFSWKITRMLDFSGNIALSRNKISNFTEFIPDFDTGIAQENNFAETDIAFSPQINTGGTLAFSPIKTLTFSFISKYIGSQFLDNTSNETRKMNGFLVNNLLLNWQIKTKFCKEISVNALLNNIFNEAYEPNGYTFSYIFGGQAFTENYYYPQAGFNFMAGVTLKF
ncbi:MAG: TonB-dependent receptor, partial [Verrucomicrobia bacterium]|nr:TonB-dependent receptor [Cytophagales bacterium]